MKMSLLIPIVLAVIAASVSVTLLLKSKNWTLVNAVITANNIEEIYHSPNSAVTSNQNTHDYQLNIKFKYTVDGANYNGDTLYAGMPNIFDTKLEAEKLAQQFSPGEQTTAYYNPKNPAQSALLKPTSSGSPNWLILAFVGFVVIAFISAGIFVVSKL